MARRTLLCCVADSGQRVSKARVSTGRVLRWRYTRVPLSRIGLGKYAHVPQIVIVALPHEAPLVMQGDPTAHGLNRPCVTACMRGATVSRFQKLKLAMFCADT